jgi:hypothetical protein
MLGTKINSTWNAIRYTGSKLAPLYSFTDKDAADSTILLNWLYSKKYLLTIEPSTIDISLEDASINKTWYLLNELNTSNLSLENININKTWYLLNELNTSNLSLENININKTWYFLNELNISNLSLENSFRKISIKGGPSYSKEFNYTLSSALFTDTFAQPNGTILGDTAEWDRWDTDNIDTINSNGVNAVITTANRTNSGIVVSSSHQTFGPNQWAEHTHTTQGAGRGTAGPLVRATTSTVLNGYTFINSEGNGVQYPNSFRIIRYVNGVATTIATTGPFGTTPWAASTQYTMRLEVVEDRLYGYINNRLVISAKDSLLTSGQPGFQIIYAGSTNSFSAGEIYLNDTPILAQRALVSEAQSYTLEKFDINLLVSRLLSTEFSSIILTQENLELLILKIFSLSNTVFNTSLYDLQFIRNYLVSITRDDIGFSGYDTAITKSYLLPITNNTINISQFVASILINRKLSLDANSIEQLDYAINLLKNSKLQIEIEDLFATFYEIDIISNFSAQGYIKVWTGSAWEAKPVKVWNGSSWMAKPLKVWNGNSWQLL